MSNVYFEVVSKEEVSPYNRSRNSDIYDAIEERLKGLPPDKAVRFAVPDGYTGPTFAQMLRMAFRQGKHRSRPAISAFSRKGFIYVSNAEVKQ